MTENIEKMADVNSVNKHCEKSKTNKFTPKTLPIVKLDASEIEVFKKEYLDRGKPAILSGFAESWPAIKWTLSNLKERVGDNFINVRRNTNLDEYKVGQKYNIEKMKFQDYIENILSESKKSKGSYMAVQNIKQAFPQIDKEVVVPEFVGKMHAGPFLWIANKGHYEFCHFDPDDNCLVVLNGSKNVRLYGCDQTTMYPNQLGSKGRTIQSQVFCDDADLEMFPNFINATSYEVINNYNNKLIIIIIYV